ncbi:MAG: hypothetical protein ACE5HP_00100 [Gemmatimonadota bacterium]
MVRSLLILLAVGVAGMAAVGIVFSLVIPLAALAIKILLVALVGYLILRLVRPDVADRIKSKMQKS